jgi:hypothetical protein
MIIPAHCHDYIYFELVVIMVVVFCLFNNRFVTQIFIGMELLKTSQDINLIWVLYLRHVERWSFGSNYGSV